MNNEDYEYRGLIASSWDLLRDDTSDWPDRAFFRNFILEDGEPALDIGCGTGRLLLDYLAEGLEVDGVDVSPEMLELCQRKADGLGLSPNLYQQGVENLDLPRAYRTILIPSSTFQLVLEPQDALEALRRCLHHLQAGGRLVLSIMDVSEDSGKGWQVVAERVRPEDGLLVRRWLRSTYDPETQLESTEDRYELIREDEVVASELYLRFPATRGYSRGQITSMMERAGFHAIEAVSGFSDAPAAPDDTLYCMIGRRG